MSLCTRMDFVDTEVLIREIEKQTCLYDVNSSEYNDKNKKTEAWNVVCRAVFPGWDNVSQNEQINVSRDIQKRWRSVRDSFMKAYKLESSGAAGKLAKRRKYIYYRQLSFLVPVIQKKPYKYMTHLFESSDGDVDDVSEENPNSSEQSILGTHLEEPTPPPAAARPFRLLAMKDIKTEMDTEHQQVMNGDANDKKDKKENFEASLLKILSRSQASHYNVEDPDRMFLLSLLPAYRKLPEGKKPFVQIEMIQTILRNSHFEPVQQAITIAAVPSTSVQIENSVPCTQILQTSPLVSPATCLSLQYSSDECTL